MTYRLRIMTAWWGNPGKSPRTSPDTLSPMDDDHRLLGPGEGIPPTKRTKLDPNTSETSSKLVGTKVGLAKEGGAVGTCSYSLPA